MKCNQIAQSINIDLYDVLNFFIKDLRLQPSLKMIDSFGIIL
jgi:hypothetical protein